MALKKSNIWVTFVRKFIANNFQISPNLVTLDPSLKQERLNLESIKITAEIPSRDEQKYIIDP